MSFGPASAGGSGTGGSIFEFPAQGQVAGALGDVVSPLVDVSRNAGAGTPAAWAYPQAKTLGQDYLYGGGSGPFQSSVDTALGGATAASDYGTGTLAPMGESNAALLSGAGQGALPYAQTALSQGADPRYTRQVEGIEGNPYYPGALTAAGSGAQYGTYGGRQMYDSASRILESGFDPQSALFNRTQDQLLDQSNVVNAMSGLAGTPYGASTTANALGNFDINWQNNQLNRQTQAAGAASPILSAVPGMVASSGALPSAVYTGHSNDLLSALSARDRAAGQGAQTAGSLLGSAGSELSRAQNLGTNAATSGAQLAQLPYTTGAGIGQNALSGLRDTTALGDDQYKLPLAVADKLMDYLSGGRQSSLASLQGGQMGVNQLGSAVGGVGSLLGGIGSLAGS